MVESDTKTFIEGKLKEFQELSTLKDNDWKFEEKEKNLNIYKRVTKDHPHPMMGCSTTIDVEPKKFLSVLLNDTYMLEIDDSKVFRKTFRSEKIDESTSLNFIYQKGKGKLMVDPRDTVICCLVSESDEEVLVVSSSVEDKEYPPVKGFVRAELIMQGWRLKKNGSSTDVTLIIQMDPKGSIPQMIISAGMKKGLGLVNSIPEYIKKKKL